MKINIKTEKLVSLISLKLTWSNSTQFYGILYADFEHSCFTKEQYCNPLSTVMTATNSNYNGNWKFSFKILTMPSSQQYWSLWSLNNDNTKLVFVLVSRGLIGIAVPQVRCMLHVSLTLTYLLWPSRKEIVAV